MTLLHFVFFSTFYCLTVFFMLPCCKFPLVEEKLWTEVNCGNTVNINSKLKYHPASEFNFVTFTIRACYILSLCLINHGGYHCSCELSQSSRANAKDTAVTAAAGNVKCAHFIIFLWEDTTGGSKQYMWNFHGLGVAACCVKSHLEDRTMIVILMITEKKQENISHQGNVWRRYYSFRLWRW